MPLFGKKDSNKKIKKDGKDDKSPSVEDKYILKELLGTYVYYICISIRITYQKIIESFVWDFYIYILYIIFKLNFK